jgi:hypothetical protein
VQGDGWIILTLDPYVASCFLMFYMQIAIEVLKLVFICMLFLIYFAMICHTHSVLRGTLLVILFVRSQIEISGALEFPTSYNSLLLELVKFVQSPKAKMESGDHIILEVLVLLKSNLTDAATFMQIKMLGLQNLNVWSLHFYQLLLVLLIGLVGCQLTKAGRTLRKQSTCGMIYILKEQIMEVPVLQEKEN